MLSQIQLGKNGGKKRAETQVQSLAIYQCPCLLLYFYASLHSNETLLNNNIAKKSSW